MPDIFLRQGEPSPADVRLRDPTSSGTPQSISITGSGGVVGSGSAPVERTRVIRASGGAVSSGSAPIERTRHSSATGGAVGSGTAPVERTRVSRGAGGVVGSGAAIVKRIRRELGTGGAAGGGQDPVERTREVIGSGGVVADGEATIERTQVVRGDGGARAAFPVRHLAVQALDEPDLPAFTFPWGTVKRMALVDGPAGTIPFHLEPAEAGGFCAVSGPQEVTNWNGHWTAKLLFDVSVTGTVDLRIIRFNGTTNPEDISDPFWLHSPLFGAFGITMDGELDLGGPGAAGDRIIVCWTITNTTGSPIDFNVGTGPGQDFGFFVVETATIPDWETTPTAPIERTRVAVGSGGITAGGSAGLVATHPAVSGGAVSGGAAVVERTRVVVGSGGATAGGAATLSYTLRGITSFPGARRISRGQPQVDLARKLVLPKSDPEPGWIKLDPTRKKRVVGAGGIKWGGAAIITLVQQPREAIPVQSKSDPTWIQPEPGVSYPPTAEWVPDPPVVHDPPRVPRVAIVEGLGGVTSGGTGNVAAVPNLRGRQQLVDEDDQLILALKG
jgi:hypothetical protein